MIWFKPYCHPQWALRVWEVLIGNVVWSPKDKGRTLCLFVISKFLLSIGPWFYLNHKIKPSRKYQNACHAGTKAIEAVWWRAWSQSGLYCSLKMMTDHQPSNKTQRGLVSVAHYWMLAYVPRASNIRIKKNK